MQFASTRRPHICANANPVLSTTHRIRTSLLESCAAKVSIAVKICVIKPLTLMFIVQNECLTGQHDCSKLASCVDTLEGYKCICNADTTDLDELRNPGRRCEKIQRNNLCESGQINCDKNARCVQNGDVATCVCLPEFVDRSPNADQPGRVCVPLIPHCSNPSLNDCDEPERALCLETLDSYTCRCRNGFYDISPNVEEKPGRLW